MPRTIVERLDWIISEAQDVAECAEDMHADTDARQWLGVAHKLTEALAGLGSALTAAKQAENA